MLLQQVCGEGFTNAKEIKLRHRIIKIYGVNVKQLEPDWYCYRWRGLDVYGTSENIEKLVFDRLPKSARLKILENENREGTE